jgi:hypothetical protein
VPYRYAAPARETFLASKSIPYQMIPTRLKASPNRLLKKFVFLFAAVFMI